MLPRAVALPLLLLMLLILSTCALCPRAPLMPGRGTTASDRLWPGASSLRRHGATTLRDSELDWDGWDLAASPESEDDAGAAVDGEELTAQAAAWAARDAKVARNWRQDSWSGHALVLSGADLKGVALRKGMVTFGTEEGTVYTVQLGSERLAQFHRLGRFEQMSGFVGKLPADDDSQGTIFRDLTVGLDALENRLAGTEPFRFVAQYAAHDGPINALLWVGPWLVSGGADGTVRVLTNKANRRGRKDDSERCIVPTEDMEDDREGGDDQEQALYNPMSLEEELIGEDEEMRVPLLTMRTDEKRANQPCNIVALTAVKVPQTDTGDEDGSMHDQGDTTLVISATEGGCLRLHDPETGLPVGREVVVRQVELDGAPCRVLAMCVLQQSRTVAVGTDEGRVVLYSLDDLLQLSERNSQGENGQVSQDSPEEHGEAVYDAAVEAVRPVHSFRVGEASTAVTALASRGDDAAEEEHEADELAYAPPPSDIICVGTQAGEVLQYEVFRDRHSPTVRHWPQLAKQQTRGRFRSVHPFSGPVTALHTDGKFVVSTCAHDGEIKAHDAKTGKECFKLTGFEEGLTGCGVDYDAGLLVCDGRGALLSMHNFETVVHGSIEL